MHKSACLLLLLAKVGVSSLNKLIPAGRQVDNGKIVDSSGMHQPIVTFAVRLGLVLMKQ